MAFGFARSRKGTIEARIEALRSELGALQQDMKGLAGDVGAAADERLTGALRAVEVLAAQALQLAQDAATDAVDNAEQWADDRLDTVRSAIRSRPLYALALSMGAGAIIGAACNRR